MKKKSSNSVFRKYYLCCFLIVMIYLLITISIIYFNPNWWSVAISAMLYFPSKLFIRISANKIIASVLYNDLDALHFKQIINSSRYFVAPLAYCINAAMLTGDYQTIVDFASLQMKRKKSSIKEKYFYLSLLARTYFELRDYEKMNSLFAEFEQYKALYPSKSFLRTPNSVWSYYKYFLEQNYEACKTVCNERNLGLNSKAWDAKIQKLQNDFLYAVACYEIGEMHTAKRCFESIASCAPKMHVASISKRYLEAIEHNQTILMFDAEILPNDNCSIYEIRSRRKRTRKRTILSILIALGVGMLVVLDCTKETEFSQFETKLNSDLIEKYEQAETITFFNVKDDVFVDSFCLAEVDGNIIFLEIVSKDGGQTLETLEILENIDPNVYYCKMSPVSGYYIGFMLSSAEPIAETLYYSFNFQLDSNTYWFYVDYIEMTSKS